MRRDIKETIVVSLITFIAVSLTIKPFFSLIHWFVEQIKIILRII